MSRVLTHVFVFTGGLVLKMTDAWSETWVPVGSPCRAFVANDTAAFAPGGSIPICGFVGGNPVVGSIELNDHVTVFVLVLSLASKVTNKFRTGLRSTLVVKSSIPAAGLNDPGGMETRIVGLERLGTVKNIKLRAVTLMLGSTGWVMTTCCAAAPAPGSLPNEIT